MKSSQTFWLHAVAAFLLIISFVAPRAQAQDAPVIKQLGAVSYISGGITADERDAMKPLAKDYNLRMDFALTVGDYLSDVKVKIRNSKGQVVLDMEVDGPWLYVQLPAGKYKVSAEYEGKPIEKSVSIAPKRGSALPFRWKGVKEKLDEPE
ncbi:MAG: carboxypeptidase regulatory-like domain-containing protein [Burkholderiaceae bacterium]|nr:carboxypeptidase regulatory-like domain-containing protein [Burkholderiaceae bacterium]